MPIICAWKPLKLIESATQKNGKSLHLFVAGHRTAVGLAIVLCFAALILSEYANLQKKSDAHILNLAGRERMLSERLLANFRLATEKGVSAETVKSARANIERTLAEWKAGHQLVLDDARKDEADQILAAIKTADFPREQFINIVRAAVRSDMRLEVPLESAREAQVKFILAQERVLTEIENHDANRLLASRRGHWISTSLLFGILLLQSLVLFRPLLRRQQEAIVQLQNQADLLQEAHEELAAQNTSLQETQCSLESAIARSDDMTRLSRFAAARFEELFAGLPIAAFTFDSNGNVFEWNREAEALFSVRASQTLGRSIVELISLSENEVEYRSMVTGVFEGDHVYNVERRIRRASGETRLVMLNAFPLRDPEGRITGGVCSMVDVTEQRIAEDRLRKSERRFREMVEHLPTGAILVEPDSIHINRYVERMTGFHKAELSTLDEWFDNVYRERSAEVRASYELDRSLDFPAPRIVPIESKDGETRHIEFFAHRADETEVWIMQDVTERLASNERFKVLFEFSSDAHLLFDETGIIDCNEATVRMLGGASKQEILAQHPAMFSPEIQPDGRLSQEKCIEMDATARAKGSHRFEWMHRKMDGTDFPVEVTLTPVTVSGRDTLLTVWHDLTEQKAAQEALRTAIAELNQAQSIARVGSWQCDGNLRDAWFSPEMRRILGREDITVPYDLTELSRLVHPEDSKSFRRNLLEAVRRRSHWEQELRIIRPDGNERIIICTGKPLPEGTKYLGTIQDVTEDRRAAAMVAESESLFRATLDAMHSGVIFMDSFEKITRTNPKGAEILGMTVDQVTNMDPTASGWGNIREDWSDLPIEEIPLIKAFRTGQPVESFVHGVRKPGGEIIWISVNSAPVFLPGQQQPSGAVSSFTDITGTRLQQQELLTQMAITNELAITLEDQKLQLEGVNKKLKALATTDGLTGINNHRRFQEFLEQEFAIAKRNRQPLSLILLDVDHFKRFNDEFGHQAGDEVLRGVAQALQSAARGSDFVARYGGEEFVIVLPGADRRQASDAAERFRQVIEDGNWSYQSVTASFGVGTLTATIRDRETLIAVTDEALYEAKRLGRNRVHHAGDSTNAA